MLIMSAKELNTQRVTFNVVSGKYERGAVNLHSAKKERGLPTGNIVASFI